MSPNGQSLLRWRLFIPAVLFVVTLYFDKFDRDWLDEVIREAYKGRFDSYDELPAPYLAGVYIGTTIVWPSAVFARATDKFGKGGKNG